MTWLSDAAVSRLRDVADWPDFTSTKYELLEKAGQGGMAAVYVALDRDLDRRVAVKVIHTAVADEQVQQRMLTEARVIARLEHPGILPIHDMGFLPDGRMYYAMKLVHGLRLDAFMEKTPLLPERLRVFLKICDAVAFAHSQGVVHRDLKPSNVMIGDFGEVLVIDWGLAKTDGTDTSDAPLVMGTPGYMAPEQEHGGNTIDQRADVYSLGIMLRSLIPAGSDPLQAVSRKASAVSPHDRYAGVSELAEEVNRFLNGERVIAFPERLLDTASRLVARHRTLVILIATYLAVRVVLLFVAR
jgi:eukaryotic-like serine/threonine-protein kinase